MREVDMKTASIMKRRQVLLIAVVFTMVVVACGPADSINTPTVTTSSIQGGTDQPAETEVSPQWTPTSASNPLRVQVMLEETGAVGEIIPVEGGTLQTTDSDGTRFTLRLPPNALLSEELITITPVVGVDELPLSGDLVASLHLAPEGLRLFEPALLFIEPPEPPVSSQLQLIGFAYHGEGDEFHLYPIEATDTGFEVQLMHFSGYGAGMGTQSDVDRQRSDHPPSSSEDQAYQDMDTGAGEEAMYNQLLAWWAGVQGSLISAQSDEHLLDFALSQFVSWRAAVMGYGLEWRFTAQIEQAWDYLASAVTFAAHRAYVTCVQEHDPVQIARILRWITWAQRTPEVLAKLNITQIQEFARKCAQFELDFDSTLDYHDIDGNSLFFHLQASRIQLNLLDSSFHVVPTSGLQYWGEGSLDYVEYSGLIITDECRATIKNATGSVLRIEELKLQINMNYFGSVLMPVPRDPEDWIALTFTYDPYPRETYHASCPDEETETEMELWEFFFLNGHEDELIEDSEVELLILIKNWIHEDSYDVYARKTYDRTLPLFEGETLEEMTILILRHTPE